MHFICAGVDDNETLKVYRSGGADPEGNQPGDLYVTIRVTCIASFINFFFLMKWKYYWKRKSIGKGGLDIPHNDTLNFNLRFIQKQ